VSALRQYEIYFTDDNLRRISKIGAVASSANQYVIPSNTIIPSDATRLVIFSKGAILTTHYYWIPLYDSIPATNTTTSYRANLMSAMDVHLNGVEIDDVVKYITAQYDMNGDNVFNAADANLIVSLLIPNDGQLD
jgi:hypothetical protein